MSYLSRRISRYSSYIHFVFQGTWLVLCIAVATTIAGASPLGQLHDDLSYHFLPAYVLGQGDAVALVPDAASAFSTNPATLAVSRPIWAVHALRVSRRDVIFQRLNAAEQYTDSLRYRREAVGTESLVHVRPLGEGSFAINVALQHEGDFQRVTTEGKQVNSFPNSIWAWGLGYGTPLFHSLRIGADIRRLRLKSVDAASPIGWGYLYSLGLTESFGEHLTLALAGRNLTRGVSLHLDDGSTQIDPQLHVGVALGRLFSDRLHLKADWSFPAHEGMRVGAGAELVPWSGLHLRVGYVRDVLRRTLIAGDLESLDGSATAPIELLWKKEGITLGATLVLSRWSLTLAWGPQHYPRADEGEMVRVESGASQLALSLVRQ